ncbi:MAG: addiction module antidote protein [Elusimicrobiota bacterium]|jgi:probable addiction module antidote protein
MRKYRTHDDYLTHSLKNPKEAALYLNAAAEENDPALLLEALAQVARAHGVTHMAKRVSLSRMGLYKTLSKKGNPEFKTFVGILKASGLQLAFKPMPQPARHYPLYKNN